MKLISTRLTNLVSLEQSHYKPMGMYGGVNFKNYLTRFILPTKADTIIHYHRFVMGLLQ